MRNLIVTSLLALSLCGLFSDTSSAFFSVCGNHCFNYSFQIPRLIIGFDTGTNAPCHCGAPQGFPGAYGAYPVGGAAGQYGVPMAPSPASLDPQMPPSASNAWPTPPAPSLTPPVSYYPLPGHGESPVQTAYSQTAYGYHYPQGVNTRYGVSAFQPNR
jgi:hypothetical protein